MRAELDRLRQAGKSVGVVPTMGYLHEGHLALCRQSVCDNDVTVATIFVNPAQFGPNMDLERYPRDEAGDLAKLDREHVTHAFIPDDGQMYPEGYSTWIDVETLSELLDGASRPGYFRGIATIVLKLFNIVRPDRAYFGEKDIQQGLIVGKMIEDLNLGIELKLHPTVREPDGLAMSSRNAYLSPEDRAIAPELFHALSIARELFAGGERSAEKLVEAVGKHLSAFPSFDIDYVEVTEMRTVQRLESVEPPAILALAVDLHGTRLIDNVILR